MAQRILNILLIFKKLNYKGNYFLIVILIFQNPKQKIGEISILTCVKKLRL